MRDLLFILTMTIVPVVLAVLMVRYTARSVYYFPFALVPLVVRTFFDPRTALFTHFIVVLLTALFTFSPAEFILLQILAGMTAVAALRDLTTRAQLARAGLFVFICYLGAYVGYALLTSSSLSSIDPYRFLAFGVSSLLLLFAYGIIYLVERAFGYISPVSLVELSNVNTPLLLRFSETAPGTFQHSIAGGKPGNGCREGNRSQWSAGSYRSPIPRHWQAASSGIFYREPAIRFQPSLHVETARSLQTNYQPRG